MTRKLPTLINCKGCGELYRPPGVYCFECCYGVRSDFPTKLMGQVLDLYKRLGPAGAPRVREHLVEKPEKTDACETDEAAA